MTYDDLKIEWMNVKTVLCINESSVWNIAWTALCFVNFDDSLFVK